MKFKKRRYHMIILVVSIIIFSISVKATTIKGRSMYPTIYNKDFLVINKLAYLLTKPSKGDIIVFESPTEKNKYVIKRIIALPGDHIIIDNNKVFLNDCLLKEDYLNTEVTDGEIDITLPKDYIFVMGDNRGISKDSRYPTVGPIPIENIVGKAVFRISPLSHIGEIK